jgi:hypothetical protein
LGATLTEIADRDFREVAHSGGKITFTIKADTEGRISYQVGWSGSRPVPMRLFAVYALPQGIPCGDIQLGGIGQSWNPPPYPSCIPVFIASDSEGCFGHQCGSCNKYWRSRSLPKKCAYCGVEGTPYQFLSRAQVAYVQHYAQTLAEAINIVEPGTTKEVVIDMDTIVDAAGDLPKPDFYHPGIGQQTQFTCTRCKSFHDIRGRHAYCCVCGQRNNISLFQNAIDDIRARLNNGQVAPEEAVKQIVSALDSCCRNFVDHIELRTPMRPRRRKQLQELLFHGMEAAASFLKATADIDLLKGVDGERDFLRMMLLRRHVYEHDGGEATARYIRESGDASVDEGTLIRETRENVRRLAGIAIRIATNLDTGFHDIFPPSDPQVTPNQT